VTLAVVVFALVFPGLGRALRANVQHLQALHRIDVSNVRRPCWAPPSGHPPHEPDHEAIAADATLAPFFRGCRAYALGKTSEAVTAWRAAGAEPFFLVDGFSYAKRGEYRWALGQYQVAALINPRSVQAWTGVTAAQMNLATTGQVPFADMQESAGRLVALTPDDPQAHYLLGYALWLARRDPRDAERELRWALDRRKGEDEAYALGRMLLDEKGRAADAIPLLEYAAARVANPEVHVVLMQAYMAVGRCDDGHVVYRAVLARNPDQRARLRQACQLSPGCPCG
jgi:tetratricopeptide (TPR) repeat protein